MLLAFIIFVLLLWFLLTLIYQVRLKRLLPLVLKWDIFRILPSYHFFSAPLTVYGLEYRKIEQGGTATRWKIVDFEIPRSLWTPVWSPLFYLKISGHCFLEKIMEFIKIQGEDKIETMFCYKALCRYLNETEDLSHSSAFQFRIFQQSQREKDEASFVSPLIVPMPPYKRFNGERNDEH